MNLDEAILRALYASGGEFTTYAMLGVTALGSGWTATLALPLLTLPKARRYVAEFAAVVLSASLLVFLLKLTIARVRPCYALPNMRALYIFVQPPHDASCPSGHAAGAFAAVTYFVIRFGAQLGTYACALLFALAGLIALSRVYLGVHYPSDIALGALLGSTTTLALSRAWGLKGVSHRA